MCAVINNSELQTGNHKETNIDEYKSRRESFNNAPWLSWSSFIDCDVCGIPTTESEMEKHVNSNHIKCELCNFTSMTNDQFEKHVCEADINTKYQTNFTATIECGKCALKFETKELLDAHLVKVHTCNVCKKVYKTPLTLRDH